MVELVALALIIVGILLVLLSFFLREGKAEAGGVVIIGPIPIVFGTSQRAALAVMVAAVLLTALALLLFLATTSPK
ncbi:MAG: TIGR00304 family membrane protein [Pyrobaculum sp.]